MAEEKFDVVIVGAGTGGLNLGALLATEGKKVLILDKNKHVGGRAFSVNHKNTWLENGIHGLILSGHLDEVFRRIGKELPLNVNKWESSQILLDGTWQDFKDLLSGSEEELERLLAEAVYDRSYEEIRRLDDVSVEKWVSDRTEDEGVLTWFRYFGWLYGATKYPPTDFSAGALFTTFKRRADANDGTLNDLGYMVSGGCGAIAGPLAESIEENGGEIRTGTTVSKVVIEDGVVLGVNVECQERVIPTQILDTQFIAAPVVVVAVPLWQILNVVSSHDLPPWYVDRLRFMCKKSLNTWTLTYVVDKEPGFPIGDLMCVPQGPVTGRPWVAAILPYAEKPGQYAVTVFLYTAWHEPPSYFDATDAGVRDEMRALFDDWEQEIAQLFPELEENLMWKTRSIGPSSIFENPGNVGYNLISMVPEGVDNLYFIGERTQEAEIQGIYGSAQVALQCADKILQQ